MTPPGDGKPPRSTLRTANMALSGVVVLLIAVGVYGLVLDRRGPFPEGAGFGGVPFVLTDPSGAPFGAADLAGRPHLLTFGPGTDPEIERLRLPLMREIRSTAGLTAAELPAVWVATDAPPPDALAVLLDRLPGAFVALTGDPAAIAALAAAWRVLPDGTGPHPIFLAGPDGAWRATLSDQDTPASGAAKLRAALAPE